MNDQLNFLISLRQKSYLVITLLNELTNDIPPSVSINKLVWRDNKVILNGTAKSNTQITTFVKNLAKSPNFTQPELVDISEETNAHGEKTFELNFQEHS